MIQLNKTIEGARAWLNGSHVDLDQFNDQEVALIMWAVGHGSDQDIPQAARPILGLVCEAIGTHR